MRFRASTHPPSGRHRLARLSGLWLPLLLGVCIACCSSGPPAETEHALITQGRNLYYTARYHEAEVHFAEVMTVADSLGDALMKAQCLKWMGAIQSAYKQNTLALARYNDARLILDSLVRTAEQAHLPLRALVTDERVNVMNNIAVVHREAGRFDSAEAIHREVLAYDLRRGVSLSAAISLNNLGVLYNVRALAMEEKGDSAGAVPVFLTARSYFAQSLDHAETPDAYLNLGNNQAYRELLDSAVASFRRAEALYERQGLRANQSLCLGNIGILLAMQNERKAAVAALRRCIALIEELRGNLSSIDVRSSFVSNKFYLYENLIALLIEQNEAEEAFEYVERAKARSLLDLIGNKAIGEEKKKSPEVAALIEREHDLQERIGLLLEIPDSSRKLVRLLDEHQDVLDDLRRLDPEYASVKSIEPVKLRELQGMLDDSTALVEYFLGETASFVFVVRRDSLRVRRLVMPKDIALDARIEQLRRKLYSSFPSQKLGVIREARLQKQLDIAQAKAEWYDTVTDPSWQFDLFNLYTILFAPIERYLQGITQLYLVPHGFLHQFPFQALVRREGLDKRAKPHLARPRFLIEDYAMAYLPSASVLRFARMKKPMSDDSALVVGDPVYADPVYRKKPLQGALIEADSVSRYIRVPIKLVREQATESEVKRLIVREGIVHLATHGELNKKEPLNSRILFAAGDSADHEDGNLTVAEVFNLDLRATLVTLSACQTAQVAGGDGAFSRGDELVGLTRSFMYAGTPSVIASLWYVDDAATLTWMRYFYDAWLRGGVSKTQAARHAALRMLAAPEDPDWVYPYYWSAFIFFGDSFE
jgi:CHAT domain-containing protein/tetratricopeptide (TPR) repeat protein